MAPKPVWNSLNWNIKEIQANHMAFRKKEKLENIKKLQVKNAFKFNVCKRHATFMEGSYY